MILFTGIVLGLLASVGYFFSGYSSLILGLLFLSLFFVGASFYERGGQNEPLVTKQDGYASFYEQSPVEQMGIEFDDRLSEFKNSSY